VIYATTPEFLSHFGLASRKDLPGIDELRAAGLLDPVDDALEALMLPEQDQDEPDEAPEEDDEALSTALDYPSESR
jgi:segregation and condensation protein B